MTGLFDDDQLLTMVGGILVLGVLIALGVVIIAGLSAPDTASDAPEMSWTVDRINDSHVRLTHQGGDQVDSESLVITVNGVRRHPSWDETISEGDSAVIRAGSDELIRLYWERDAGKRIPLKSWRVD